ncbi:MAG: hypothetical protein JNL74_24630 [Fibrobacteres bacterium]|nr:hypothetical protein [Fibrobacterota bacterium]
MYKCLPFNIFRTILGLSILLYISSYAESDYSKLLKHVEYPEMVKPHSSWGSIGYSEKTDKVIIGVCDHESVIGLFEWDCKKEKMSLRSYVHKGANLQEWQWQGKIHSQIVENSNDGWMYFGTDGGENREEYYMDHPHGYNGGFFMKYNPSTYELINLGNAVRYESIKEMVINQKDNLLYAISYPSSRFIIKNLATGAITDKGMINKAYVARTLFTDSYGNGYYTDMRGCLIKYEPDGDTILWSDTPLFMEPSKTESWKLRSGIRAFATDSKKGIFYFQTAWSRLFSIKPQKKGIGEIKDLGYLLNPSETIHDTTIIKATSPNLALAPNGKLYYWLGGHGSFLFKDTSVLVECDPETKEKNIVYKCPKAVMEEATGSQIIDKKGKIYFAGRRAIKGESSGESGSSRAHLIIFTPPKKDSK